MKELYNNYYEEGFSQSKSQRLDWKSFELTTRKFRWNYRRFFAAMPKDIGILDLGCGLGQFLYYLHIDGFHNITGIDISESQVQLARKMQPYLDIRHIENPIDFLRERPATFDVITMNDALEHIELNQLIPTIKAVHHALKPNGLIITKTVNAAYPLGNSARYIDLTHKVAFHEKSLTQLLRHAEFTGIHCYQEEIGLYNPFFVVKKTMVILVRLLLKLLIYFSESDWPRIISVNVIAIGQKKEDNRCNT